MTDTTEKDAPHDFEERVDDASMCRCGVPATEHWRVEPTAVINGVPTRFWPPTTRVTSPGSGDVS